MLFIKNFWIPFSKEKWLKDKFLDKLKPYGLIPKL